MIGLGSSQLQRGVKAQEPQSRPFKAWTAGRQFLCAARVLGRLPADQRLVVEVHLQEVGIVRGRLLAARAAHLAEPLNHFKCKDLAVPLVGVTPHQEGKGIPATAAQMEALAPHLTGRAWDFAVVPGTRGAAPVSSCRACVQIWMALSARECCRQK